MLGWSYHVMCGRADESHLTGESEDVLKRPGGAALMLSGAKARCPALVSMPDGPAPDAGSWQGLHYICAVTYMIPLGCNNSSPCEA